MVRLIMGVKGSGKTKQLIELINAAAKDEAGNVVCIEPKRDMSYNIHYNIRLIDAQEYDLHSYEVFRGFISGLYAGNYDISQVFIDNLCKTVGTDVDAETEKFLNWLDGIERAMLKAEADAGFYAPGPFKELVEKPKGIISLGAKMGEGWLLTAEMIELVQGGYGNIVCAQPFGCLPNHIVGKGMVNKIRALYPSANITPIDYDPSATKVNQENRIKLMLAVAKERLNAPVEARPLTAEEIAGGAPKVGAAV